MDKLVFLRNDFFDKIEKLPLERKPLFGKMNAQQMIEHMSYSFQVASGKIQYENKQSDELTKKMYNFIMSDKPFRENTPNSNIGKETVPLKFPNKKEAVLDLRAEFQYFIDQYELNEDLRIDNPFFGSLNFEEQVHLLHKHALHHLRQFECL